ncbi:MAG: hypothetical protein CMG57_08755 [Candidatus Marinimicrobia bacterium]|nr:hypothetical protein [Candidatus Neomarinimicrobiota bacterium]|tara:strand:- start:1049 stop:1777 length:729 start_codon:yes stop_codon:yes gene_type:complete
MSLFLKRVLKLFQIFQSGFYINALLKNYVLASVEHSAILKKIEKCETIIDIGANKGQFSLVSRKIFPDSKIFSFEPLNEPVIIFKKLFEDDKNTIMNQVAIGYERGRIPINVSKKNDSSSILPIGLQQKNIFPGTDKSHSEDIQISRLKDFISLENLVQPVFVKIDVQGYELEVLRGCDDLIEHFKYLFIECSYIELYEGQALAFQVLEFLNSRRFKLQGVYNTSYDKKGIAVQSDFLFSKE